MLPIKLKSKVAHSKPQKISRQYCTNPQIKTSKKRWNLRCCGSGMCPAAWMLGERAVLAWLALPSKDFKSLFKFICILITLLAIGQLPYQDQARKLLVVFWFGFFEPKYVFFSCQSFLESKTKILRYRNIQRMCPRPLNNNHIWRMIMKKHRKI